MINVYAVDTDYNEVSTGTMEITVEKWMGNNSITIDDLVAIEGNELVFHIEWGNGEGHDEIRVTYAIQ